MTRSRHRFTLASATVIVVGLLGGALPAAAGTPVGYKLCGYPDYENGGWTFDPPQGAGSVLYAKNITCTAARINFRRLRYSSRPPYRPILAGYRCKVLLEGYEYNDTRCLKRHAIGVAIRVQSGA